MVEISQVVKKWRETKPEGEESKEQGPFFRTVVEEIVSYYEKQREDARKKFPEFLCQLQEGTETEKKVVPEKKQSYIDKAEKTEEIRYKETASREDESDWDIEMRDFTKGLFDDDDEEEEEEEYEHYTENEKEDEPYEQDDIEEEEYEEKEEDEEEEEEKNGWDGQIPEDESLNLENLLKSISEKEDQEHRNAKHKGSHRRIKRGRKKTGNDKKRKTKR